MPSPEIAYLPPNAFEIERYPWGTLQWLCHDRHFSDTVLTVGLCELEPGLRNPVHFHPNCEEVLHVLAGTGWHTVAGRGVEVVAGSVLRVPRLTLHGLTNTGRETLRTLIAISSGRRETTFLESPDQVWRHDPDPLRAVPRAEEVAEWSRWLLDSHRRWTGRELIERTGSVAEDARRLFTSPVVVVSHGTQDDPILCYGNRAALQLWETDWATLTRTPSRLTAEPVHRDERARLLARTTRDGYVEDYQGVRISTSGKRFHIARATVWNLVDDTGRHIGQAAAFEDFTHLPTTETPSP